MEVYSKLPQHFHRHQRKFRGSFLDTSSDTGGSFEEVSWKLPLRHFDFGLLILILAANFARSVKPKFYYEVKKFTLQVDFEGKVKTGQTGKVKKKTTLDTKSIF